MPLVLGNGIKIHEPFDTKLVAHLPVRERMAEHLTEFADVVCVTTHASQLEREWEQALRELEAEEQFQEEQVDVQYAIPEEILEELKDIGSNLPTLWDSGVFTTAQKKALLRTLLDKVVIRREAGDSIYVCAVWRGGATTSGNVRVTNFKR